MAKIQDIPLVDLYAKKMTASVEAVIQVKEDFTKISMDYCTAVCKLKCKNPTRVHLLNLNPEAPLDILIIQDNSAPKGKWDKQDNKQEVIQRQIIDFLCKEAGFQGLNYRVTNLLKCAPTETDFPRGKAPSVTILSKCKPYLLSEIKRTNPKVIISLGTAVTKALGYKKHSNTGNRGEIVDGRVLITLHPKVLCMIRQNASGKLWGNDYFNIVKRDFEKAAAMVRGQLIPQDLMVAIEAQRKNIIICRNIEAVQTLVDIIMNLPEGRMISVDTETTGLDGMAEDARVLCIQFGWRDPSTNRIVAAVVPLWHRENNYIDPVAAWKILTPILISEGIPKVLHNGKFDILYVYHTTGLRIKGMAMDTMLMLHALDSGIQGCLSLKTAMWDHCLGLGIGGYESLLPKLTKIKKTDSEEEEEDGSDD